MSTLENRRFFLMAIFGVLLFFIYQEWKKEHPELPAPSAQLAVPLSDAITPPAAATAAPQTPAAATAPATSPAEAPTAPAVLVDPAARVTVSTDKLKLSLSLAGADIHRVELLDYAASKAAPQIKLALLNDVDPHFFILQSGLAGSARPYASDTTGFATTASSFELPAGANSLDVPFTSTDAATGITVTKTYRFTRGSYQIELIQTLKNGGTAAIAAASYARIQRLPPAAGDEPPFSKSFTGVGFYEQSGEGKYRFKKVALDKLHKEPIEATQSSGWLAMLQHYFLAAIIAPAGEQATFAAKPSSVKGYLGQYYGPMRTVVPAQTVSYSTKFYVGPTLNGVLGDVAPGLDLTEDYGIFSPIAKPLFWLLKFFHKWVGNWGLAIILLTLTVKAGMYKLSEKQFRSMAKMKQFAPKIAEIKERYADDKEKLNKAMMELYTKQGFNPLAGCWPLLVQFPVFISLYWVLAQSVELRQATFGLWLTDLSSPDPFYVLPVLFGISMFAQQKIQGTAATMDPMQAKMMQFMPIGLTAFFAFFPAGLVLYWFVSNLITIAQQWLINKTLEKEGLKEKAPAKIRAAIAAKK